MPGSAASPATIPQHLNLLFLNWFDPTHPLWGGAEVYLHETARRLVQRGHRVTLLCSRYAGCQPESEVDGIRVLRLGHFWTFHLEVPYYYRRALAKERWDCVFEYTNKVPMLSPLFVRAPLVAVAHHLVTDTLPDRAPDLLFPNLTAPESAAAMANRLERTLPTMGLQDYYTYLFSLSDD